jgi:hypothetical protein
MLTIDEHTNRCNSDISNLPNRFEIYDAQKNIHWFELKDTPVYDETGKGQSVDDIVQDIIVRKQTDNRLTRLSFYDEGLVQKLDSNEENYGNPAKPSITVQACPRCGSAKTRRSLRRSNDGILRILFYKAYRCRKCHFRFWMVNPLRLVLIGGMTLIVALIVGRMWFSTSQQTAFGSSVEAVTNKQIERLTEEVDAEAELHDGLHYILTNKGIKDN